MGYFLKNMKSRKKMLLSLLLAAAVTIALGVYLPLGISWFNDSVFGKVTILDKPELVDALKAAEDKGVIMAVHGYHHEDFSLLDPDTAQELVEKGVAVFEEAGLTSSVWYTPYMSFRRLPEPVQEAIASVLPSSSLPRIEVLDERGDDDDLLEVGEIWVYTGTYNITQAMIDSNGNGDPIDGKIHNTVTVDSDQTEVATADTGVAITQVTEGPSLEVTIVADPINMMVVAPNDRIDAGDIIPYTVEVFNTGSQNLTNVTVWDSLRTRLARSSWRSYEESDLEVGDDWTYTGTYNITLAMIDSNGNGDPIDGKIHNTVIVDSDQTEVVTADTAIPIVQGPFLNVVQTAGDINMRVVVPNDHVDAGDTISYTIKIYNTGSQTLTNVTVNSSLLDTLKRGTTLRRGWGEYTFGWRDMESFDDPRYAVQKTALMMDSPTFIMMHFYDWNQFTKQLIYDYLATTREGHVEVRIDDVEYNTPVWKVPDLAELLDNYKVVRVSFGVIPEGTWIGGDPHLSGISVNHIFRFYWVFFLAFAFFPLIFLLFWRILTRKDKNPGPNGGSFVYEPKAGKKPRVSIIVPAYNEEDHISSCLEAIQKQDYEGDMEVIVVNDGSTDRTAEIASKYPINLIDLETNVGKADALNVGIERSKGDILVFSDSDSELASNAVNLLVNSLEVHPDAGAVAGNIYINDIAGKNNLLKHFQMIEYYTDQEISRRLQSLSGNVLICPGPLFAVKREIAEKTMFNDRSFIEDADFTMEILESNRKVLREPKAKAYTNAPLSLKSWFNQRKRWWYGNLQLWRIHNKWARKNPWMLFTYLGFITCLISLILLLLLPYLFLTYDNINLILLRGIVWAATPILLFTLLIMPFFVKNQRLLLALIPYALLYGAIRTVTLCYIYLRYIFRRGIKATWGSRTVLAR